MAKNTIEITKKNGKVTQYNVVPQQRVIKVNKVSNKKSYIDFYSFKAALKNLSYKGFQLYAYFATKDHNLIWAMSLSEIIQSTALSRSTHYTAFDELIEKGYMKKEVNEQFDNFYNFYEKQLQPDQRQRKDINDEI